MSFVIVSREPPRGISDLLIPWQYTFRGTGELYVRIIKMLSASMATHTTHHLIHYVALHDVLACVPRTQSSIPHGCIRTDYILALSLTGTDRYDTKHSR